MKFLIPDELKNSAGIYSISAPNVFLYYVGASLTFSNRFNTHKAALKSGRHENKGLQALAEHAGFENLEFAPLEVFDTKGGGSLAQMEQKWIDYFPQEALLNKDLISRLPSVLPEVPKMLSRIPRAMTFSFDEDGDKARYHLLAKAESRSLASLIKHLLEQHAKQQGTPKQ
jgi:hypothetical protein